jgi:hypothetical protein
MMDMRSIAPPEALPGRVTVVEDKEVRYTLFEPDAMVRKPSVTLTIHFHGAPWFAIGEHLRRGLDGPMIAFDNGQGSNAYRRPFEDRQRLARWVRTLEKTLGTKVDRIDISSYSAGYGAVREIVKSPEYVRLVHRIVLADSVYAGYEPIFPGAATRRPAQADIEPWRRFVRLAAEGKKQFVLTHSQVPTGTYANSVMCARWVGMMAGRTAEVVMRPGGQYPLLTRLDQGGLHIWGYAGDDANAHIVHARRIAEIWHALDR